MNTLQKSSADHIINHFRAVTVDVETIQYIIESLGMNDQMLRQLIMSNPESDIKDLLEEKIDLSNQGISDNNLKIRDFYLMNYDDKLGEQINPKATFIGLFEVMDNYGDVYDYIGVADSVIRERIFNELSLTMGVSYNYVYEQYLLCI